MTNLIPGARVGKGESGTLPGAEGGDDVPSADMTALRQLCNVTGGGGGGGGEGRSL